MAPGRHQRRLFELLEEQKEPFMLDVYLLENGCSSSACRRLQSLSSNAFKRRGRLLRCALSKLLKVKTVKMILNWNGKTLIPDCVSEIGIDTHESEFRFLYGSTIGLRGLDRRYRWSCIEMEGTEQLSPVSVLQLHSDEDSSFHSHGKEKDPSTSSLDLLHSPKKASKISETKREMNLLDEKLLDCVEELNSIAQLIGADLFL